MPKKTFSCGHTGRGQYCHRCAQESREKEKPANSLREKQEWKQSFEHDVVDLTPLPNRSLVLKARNIINAIGNGESHMKFKGKRLQCDRNIISVPLSWDYRIVFIADGVKLVPHKVLSHEAYDSKRPGII